MKTVLVIYSLVAIAGLATMRYSEDVLHSIKSNDGVAVSPLEFSEGQTKLFPDVQLQPALAVQGTVGVE